MTRPDLRRLVQEARARPDDLLRYISCPLDGDRIAWPFVSTSGPVPYPHRRKPYERPCRLIVTPDPRSRRVEVISVPRGVAVEDVLRRRVEEWWDEVGHLGNGAG